MNVQHNVLGFVEGRLDHTLDDGAIGNTPSRGYAGLHTGARGLCGNTGHRQCALCNGVGLAVDTA